MSAFLIILFLVTSCAILPVGLQTKQVPATPTALPPLTKDDICPQNLHLPKTCQTPHSLRVAYGVESLYEKGYTGEGQTVIDMVSFGSPTLKQDMDVFDRTFGLPPVDLQVISPLHEKESDPHHDKEGWAGETTLDVQIIHSIAPKAKIIVLTSPVSETEGVQGLPEFRQLEHYIIDNKLGNIVSFSWGASELTLMDGQGQKEIQQWNDLLQQASKQQKITHFSASGDNGATDYADAAGNKLATVPTTSFPSDSPWIVGVGGTTLTRIGTALKETAWSGSGGGFSRFYQAPDYQQPLAQMQQKLFQNHRGVPDVAAVADPFTGLAVYQDKYWTLGGGTSASAPLWAGIIAIGNQMAGRPLGYINPALYKISSSSAYSQDFRSITSGNNSSGPVKGYSAGPGWNPVTGLGTPNAEKLLPDLIADTPA
jgi:subtilase family serine protease